MHVKASLTEGNAPMEPQPEHASVAVVLVGSFHPGIIQPSWLAKSGLLSDSEAESADIAAISNDVSQFSTAWFSMQALPNRIAFNTQLSAYYGSLKDLVAGTLSVLPGAQVTAFGINYDAHFKLDSEERWNALGHDIVPKRFWETVVEDPGTANVTIQGARPNKSPGRMNLTFAPSPLVNHGIALGVNDHYDVVQTSNAQADVEGVIELLKRDFSVSLKRSEKYFTDLLKYADSIKAEER